MKNTRANVSQDYTQRLKDQMRDLIEGLRANVTRVSEPRARALFETSAEVISGLVKAFEDYEQKNEPAWKDRA